MDSVFFYRNPEPTTTHEGSLRGLKIAVQPGISVAGWPSDAGSKALANFRALEDATLVRRLRQAGAVLCGSTRISEFGFGLQGSRAGDAVRRRAADVELVLDIMGESRLAASRAGVSGFKPSYGLVSRLGVIGLIPSMECCGLLSHSVTNIRENLRVIAGRDEADFSQPDEEPPDFSAQQIDPQKTTVGIILEAQNALQAREKAAFRSSVDALGKAGFLIRELSLPDFDLFLLVHKIIGSVEASSSAGRYDSVRYGLRLPGAKNWNEMYLLSRGASFGRLLKSYLIQGAYFQFGNYGAYENACRIRARLLAAMLQLASQADFLIIPADPGADSGAHASLSDMYAQFAFTVFANVTGQPALFLAPAPGAPQSGFQLAGPRRSDARLLALGEQLLKMRQGGN